MTIYFQAAIYLTCVLACVLLRFIWYESGRPAYQARGERVIRAEWGLFVLGLITGALLASTLFPIARHLNFAGVVGISFVGGGILLATFLKYKEWHIQKAFQRNSLLGLGREVVVFLWVAALATLFSLAVWQEVLKDPNPDTASPTSGKMRN